MKEPTRAEKMAANLKGLEFESKKAEPRVIRMKDEQTQEMKDRFRIAREKLRSFKDLVG